MIFTASVFRDLVLLIVAVVFILVTVDQVQWLWWGFRWRICSFCEGSGKSSAYLGAFTRSGPI